MNNVMLSGIVREIQGSSNSGNWITFKINGIICSAQNDEKDFILYNVKEGDRVLIEAHLTVYKGVYPTVNGDRPFEKTNVIVDDIYLDHFKKI